MSVLLFLGHHWLIAGSLVLAIVGVVLEPAIAFTAARWLIGTATGRRVLAIAALVGVLSLAGTLAAGHYRDEGRIEGVAAQTKLDAVTIAGKNAALQEASRQLAAASAALDRINVEAAREIAQARQDEKDAQDAGALALAAKTTLDAKARNFDRALQDARHTTTCDALLSADVARQCGLP